jgi:hypothetical protein
MADKKISALTAATTPLVGSEVLPIVQGAATVKVSVDNLTAGKAVSFLSSASGLGAVATPSYTFTGDANTGMWSPAADTIAFSANGAERLRVAVGTTSVTGVLNTSTGVVGNIASFSDGIAQTITIATGAGYAEIRNPNAGAIIFSNPTTRMNISAAGDVTVSTGNIIIGTAGKGIDFSANTHAAGMTSELLNDYEEGTWTPLIYGTSGGTFTSTAAIGRYTKVGRMVTVYCRYTYTSIGTVGVNDYAFMSGLPFASANTGTEIIGSMQIGQLAFQTRIFQPKMGNNNSIILFQYDNGIGPLYAGGVYMVASSFPASGDITISMTYFV